MLARVRIFLEMIKFSHTVFALPFALLATAVACERDRAWRWLDLLGVVACMIFARSAAMGFNRWADRKLDAENPRTKSRAIPAGLLSPRQVLVIIAVCSAGFIAGTAIFWFSSGNLLPLMLSVPVLLFLFAYSYTKRFTWMAHLWLGSALALAPVAAWIAIRGQVEVSPLLLAAAIAFWVAGFDIIYACQDIDVDRRLGLKSIPAWLGFGGAMNVARGSHVITILFLVLFGLETPEVQRWYWMALIAVALLLFVEHWLVRSRDLMRINVAFLHVNGVISVGLFAATLADLFLSSR